MPRIICKESFPRFFCLNKWLYKAQGSDAWNQLFQMHLPCCQGITQTYKMGNYKQRQSLQDKLVFFKFTHLFIYLYLFTFYFSRRLITSQYCGDFRHTFKWISHGCTYVPLFFTQNYYVTVDKQIKCKSITEFISHT